MNKKNYVYIKGISIVFLLFFSLLFVKVNTYADTGVKVLQANKIYKDYDFTGNKKRDSIVLRQKMSGYNLYSYLYINGKKMYTMPKGDWMDSWMYAITLSNGRTYLILCTEGANPGISDYRLVQYRNGKVTSVANFNTAMKNFAGAQYISMYPEKNICVSGNTVKITMSEMTWTFGSINMTYIFKYKNGSLIRSSSIGEAFGRSQYTVAKTFSVYTNNTSYKKVFSVRQGDQITLINYYLKDGNLWFKIKNNTGKSGWIKGLRKQSGGRSPLFTNGWYSN